MKHYQEMVADLTPLISELMPWDVEARIEQNPDILVVDVREPSEFELLRIPNSINVPRGVLESACEWDYTETVAALVTGREREIILVCRSGLRSVFAAHTLQIMGFKRVISLKTGIKGWNDAEQPLIDKNDQTIDADDADEFFVDHLRPDQQKPKT